LTHGNDLALLAIGHMVQYAWRAAQLLAAAGVQAAVYDACAVWPPDTAALARIVQNTRAIVTLEDHVVSGGFGSAVAEYIAGRRLDAHLLRIGVPDRFVEHGALADLYHTLGWQPEQLAAQITAWLREQQ
jgi:1-deoxy-D-xylulose-5-phosphate synthase